MSPEPLALSRWGRARWIVLAPHPDDETLGAGALIAETAANARLAGVVYLTDGTGSHPAGTPGLAAARRIEARTAISRLAGRMIAPDWIGWQDAHPPATDSARFTRDAMRLGALLRRRRIDAIAVTGLAESHCDHVAAYRLASAAARFAKRNIVLFAYHVWNVPSDRRARRIETRPLLPGRRRNALDAHRSQLSNVFGAGFRLSAAQRRMKPTDMLILQGTCR